MAHFKTLLPKLFWSILSHTNTGRMVFKTQVLTMTPEQQIRAHEEWCQLRIQAAEHDRDYALGLASAAHLELIQAIKYGFNPGTAHSTLISIGKLSPRLNEIRQKMLEEQQ
jgi:hypothetical protein